MKKIGILTVIMTVGVCLTAGIIMANTPPQLTLNGERATVADLTKIPGAEPVALYSCVGKDAVRIDRGDISAIGTESGVVVVQCTSGDVIRFMGEQPMIRKDITAITIYRDMDTGLYTFRCSHPVSLDFLGSR